MDFYFVEKDYAMELPIDGEQVTYVFLRTDPQRITADRLYFAPSDEIKRIIERFHQAGYKDFNVKVFIDKRQIFEHPKFPIDLTYSGGYFKQGEEFIPLEEKIKPLLGKDKIRVAVVNGMGGGIGDNIVGMTALNIFYDRLMNYFKEVDIGIFTLRPRGLPILRQETIVNEIYLMPAPAELLFQYDAIVDLSNMTGWPIFKQPFMDFFINAFSIDPKSVPDEQKRCFVKINEQIARELYPIIRSLKSSAKKLLLYHPLTSSPIRSIPNNLVKKYLKKLIKLTDYTIVSVVNIDFKHSRFVNLFPFSKKGIDYFFYLVSQMDAIITVDTATTHLADAFSIPAVDLCTTIPPKWYVCYYPFVEGILVGGGEFPEIYTHASDNKEDLEKVYKNWMKFSIEDALELLEKMIVKRENELPHKPCPVCLANNPFIPSSRYRFYNSTICQNCEAEYAYPRKTMDYNEAYFLDSTESGDKYSDYISTKDADSLYISFISNPRFHKVRECLEVMPIKKTLLDVGCANGFFVRYAKSIGFSAYGIDVSKAAINYGRKYFKLTTIEVCSDLKKLPKRFPKYFQVITAFEVIEHLENPYDFVRSVYELLENGGIFIFSTPNRDMLGRKLGLKDERQFFLPGHRDSPPGHLTRFTAKSHKILVEQLGFHVLWQYTVPPLSGDILRALGDRLQIPNLTIKLDDNRHLKLPGDKLKPLLGKAFESLIPSLQEQGLFLITAAIKDTSAP